MCCFACTGSNPCKEHRARSLTILGSGMLQDQDVQIARKKRRTTTRVQARSIAGASLEVRHCMRCLHMYDRSYRSWLKHQLCAQAAHLQLHVFTCGAARKGLAPALGLIVCRTGLQCMCCEATTSLSILHTTGMHE